MIRPTLKTVLKPQFILKLMKNRSIYFFRVCVDVRRAPNAPDVRTDRFSALAQQTPRDRRKKTENVHSVLRFQGKKRISLMRPCDVSQSRKIKLCRFCFQMPFRRGSEEKQNHAFYNHLYLNYMKSLLPDKLHITAPGGTMHLSVTSPSMVQLYPSLSAPDNVEVVI